MKVEVSRVLVPTDFGETSDAALGWAVALVDACKGSLHLLHVIETVAGAEPLALDVGGRTKLDRAVEAKALDALSRLLTSEEQTRLRVQLTVEMGIPLDEILRYVDAHHVDLIAMGRHGRHGVKEAILGRVAEGVVRDAPCPVLTVRRREKAPL